jgi:hypothetical protein
MPSPASTVVSQVPAITRPSSRLELKNSSSRSSTAALATFDSTLLSARAETRDERRAGGAVRDYGHVAQRGALARGELREAEGQVEAAGADLGREQRAAVEPRRVRLIAKARRQSIRDDDVCELRRIARVAHGHRRG